MHLSPEAAARAKEAERQPLPPHEAKEWVSAKETENGQHLAEISGTEFEHALAILRKHDGDLEKAADSIFSNATADDTQGRTQEELESIANISGRGRGAGTQSADRDVIDLTGEDSPPRDARSRSRRARSNPPTDTRFRATTRSPDPAWQMVRSNQPTDVKSEDDQLKEVMQASLHEFAADEVDTVPDNEVVLREDGRPIVLRADAPGKAYAALVIQCLFNVPQVRQRCSKLHLNLVDGNLPRAGHGHEWAMWTLIEMFTALDLGVVTVFTDEELLTAWGTHTLTQTDSLAQLSKLFLAEVAAAVQSDLDNQGVEEVPNVNKLFHFKHCKVHIPVTGPPRQISDLDTGHVVTIDINPESPPNELVTRLSQTLNTYHDDDSSEHQLIQEPSEMVTFHINVNPLSSTTGGPSPEPFVFPKSIYMDQFLAVNLDLANETRASQRQIQKDLELLTTKKQNITRFEDRDVFEDLRGGIDYYENVAQCDTPERLAQLKTTATKLKNILQKFEAEVADIDEKIASLQTELDGLFDNPELQCHPYDLRSVLVHTGLPGRKHIYSYVHDKGVWWKTVDYTVTEVSEEVVLSDPAGLHLGAGPYMLMYSRRQSDAELREPVNWPPGFIQSVSENNAIFMQQLGQKSASATAAREEDMMDLS
ncbi:hypothetical protein C8F04DRAFT_277914 [Mycena alexandri]|uniref:USP domain-containing protein n=1 Tax=Mycena alexandri TaxID=1745969 RepID=A0AAD6T5R9_9AGAR|nr:hypothetical protein C8F04DRAFT_277914 [Mycena alexandri]